MSKFLVFAVLLAALGCKQHNDPPGERVDLKNWQQAHGAGAAASSSGSAAGGSSADAAPNAGGDADASTPIPDSPGFSSDASGSGSADVSVTDLTPDGPQALPYTAPATVAPVTTTAAAATPASPATTPPPVTTAPKPAAAPVFAAADAKAALAAACAACHERGKGALDDQWPLDPAASAATTLGDAAYGPAVYWSIKEKTRGLAAGDPAPMPPSALSASDAAKLARLVAYIEATFPATVSAARAKFEKASPAGTPAATTVVLSYSCAKPLTYRRFLARATEDFFDRPPTPAEMALGGSDPDHALTVADRSKLVARLGDAAGWLPDFERVTLKKFAARLGATEQLRALPGISDEQLGDLREELYRLLLAKYKTTPYADILLGDELQATAATAPLYGCNASGAGWSACALGAPRSSYFSSVGFLLSKPSSFLLDNNNYGRVKLLHFFISGDVFKSATDGPSGAAAKSLPACLKTKDWRGTYNSDKSAVAPFGSAAVPATGAFCQSCHIARNMAAGSILFRPFSAAGLVYERQTRVALDPALDDATTDKRVNHVKGFAAAPVTAESLTALVNSTGEQACAADLSGAGKDVVLKDVKALAKYLIGDGSALATGLARHIPRVLSNQSQTTDELVHAVSQALASGGRLQKAFAAYLGSVTYACAAGGQ